MPGWHAATRDFQEDGRLQVIGIVQEQHPERARLFMQWKRMDWPVLVDSMNLLDVAVVPITVLIDEHGIVRDVVSRRADPREVVESFLAQEFPASDAAPPEPTADTPRQLRRRAEREASAGAWLAYAQALILRGGDKSVDRAIDAFTQAIQLAPGDRESGAAAFGLGVAHRRRFESRRRRPGDFQAAVTHWSMALAIDPNNYIRRRRIQQYGPRLDKPYPFYDWVDQARAEITARGQSPVELPVEPEGAELAQPARGFDGTSASADNPDPQGKIRRDDRHVGWEATVVRDSAGSSGTARVHVEFRPDTASRTHWNNEAQGLTVWLDPPIGWQVDAQRIELDNPPTAVSDEVRRLEFEVQPAAGEANGTLRGYALYYVCEGVKGSCLYRRQDLEFSLSGPVSATPAGGTAGRTVGSDG